MTARSEQEESPANQGQEEALKEDFESESAEEHISEFEKGEEKEAVTAGEKRKKPPTSSDEPASKISRTDAERAIISFLLSPEGLELCRNPTSEPKSAPDTKEQLRDYFSPDLTAFEHLVCAVILSRPISHNLGQRTIATVLNEPWSWNNAQKILDAGKENEEGKTLRVEAMEEARTQHRQKTASELGGLAQCVVDENWDEDGDGSLKGLLEQVKGSEGSMRDNLRTLVKGKVKGLGNTGLDIFLRRVQGCEGWEGIGWFVDGKTKDALEKVGLSAEADMLKKLVENDRKDFVVISERALGIVLEGKQEQLKKQA